MSVLLNDKPWSEQTCTCIAISHPLHKPNECDEPPVWKGGICTTCRYWVHNEKTRQAQ